jgi:hypothetical protein
MSREDSHIYRSTKPRSAAPAMHLSAWRILRCGAASATNCPLPFVLGDRGTQPYGYIRRCRFTQQNKSYRFPSSSYGMKTGRCWKEPWHPNVLVRRPLRPFSSALLTEIYLCAACSCHEIMRTQRPRSARLQVLPALPIDLRRARHRRDCDRDGR